MQMVIIAGSEGVAAKTRTSHAAWVEKAIDGRASGEIVSPHTVPMIIEQAHQITAHVCPIGINKIDRIICYIGIAVERLGPDKIPSQQIGAEKSPLAGRYISELSIVEPRFPGSRVPLVTGKLPLVRDACLIPGFTKRKVPKRPYAGATGVTLCAVGEVVGMVVGGGRACDRDQQLRAGIDVFLTQGRVAGAGVFRDWFAPGINVRCSG